MGSLIAVLVVLGLCIFSSIMILKAGIKGKDEFWIAVGAIFTAMFISLTINIISDIQNIQPEPKDTAVVYKNK
jgi:hypothetical protein